VNLAAVILTAIRPERGMFMKSPQPPDGAAMDGAGDLPSCSGGLERVLRLVGSSPARLRRISTPRWRGFASVASLQVPAVR